MHRCCWKKSQLHSKKMCYEDYVSSKQPSFSISSAFFCNILRISKFGINTHVMFSAPWNEFWPSWYLLQTQVVDFVYAIMFYIVQFWFCLIFFLLGFICGLFVCFLIIIPIKGLWSRWVLQNYKWIACRISNLDCKCTWHFEKKTQPLLLRSRFLLYPKGGVKLGYYFCRIHSKCFSAYDLTELLFLCKQIQFFLLIVVHVQRYLPVQLMFCSIPALCVLF